MATKLWRAAGWRGGGFTGSLHGLPVCCACMRMCGARTRAHTRVVFIPPSLYEWRSRECASARTYTRDIWITRCVKSRLHEVEKIVLPAFPTRREKRKRYNAPLRDIDTINDPYKTSSSNPNAYGRVPLLSEEIFFSNLWLNLSAIKVCD